MLHWAFFFMILLRAQGQPFWIPSGSMEPALLPGDFAVAGYTTPAQLSRGDVVVFRHPVTGAQFVKRLIGLPGDTVQIVDGRVNLNGTALTRTSEADYIVPYVPQGPMQRLPRCANGPLELGDDCISGRFRETLPDSRSWQVLDIEDSGAFDNTDLFTVPPGHAFVLGDNRDNSMDSRFPQDAGGLGFVPLANIFAEPRTVIFSSAGPSLLAIWTWRPERFFARVE